MNVNGQELLPENWRKVVVPANMSLEQLIVLMGRLNAQRKFLDKVYDYCKEAIAGKRNEEFDEDFGEYHCTRTLEAGRVSPNKELIISEQGEEWWNAHLKKGEDFWMVKIRRIEGTGSETEA